MANAPAPRRVLVVLFFGVLMAALDIAIVGPALTAIRDAFALDERSAAWIFNTFVLFNLLGLPLMAKLGDVYGRRNVYVVDVLLFAVGSLVVATAPSFGVLLVGRALQGLGTSGIFPVAGAVVGDTFPPEKQGRTLGILGAVFGLAFIIGPMIAGVLLLAGWRWLFVVNLVLAAGVGVAAVRVLPASRPGHTRAIDVQGVVTLGLMLGALAFGLSRLDTAAIGESLLSGRVLPFLLLSLVLLPVFLRTERRAEDPLLRLSLFSSRQVVIASVLAVGAGLTEAAFIFFPALAVEAFGVTKSTASFMLLPLVTAVAVGSPVMGRALDRVGSRGVVVTSTALLSAGLAVMGTFATQRTGFYAGSILIGLGLSGLLGSALSYILLTESAASERTVAQGVITLFISIGQLTGGALIGAIASSAMRPTDGFMAAFLVLSGVAGTLTAVSLFLHGRERERALRSAPVGSR